MHVRIPGRDFIIDLGQNSRDLGENGRYLGDKGIDRIDGIDDQIDQ